MATAMTLIRRNEFKEKILGTASPCPACPPSKRTNEILFLLTTFVLLLIPRPNGAAFRSRFDIVRSVDSLSLNYFRNICMIPPCTHSIHVTNLQHASILRRYFFLWCRNCERPHGVRFVFLTRLWTQLSVQIMGFIYPRAPVSFRPLVSGAFVVIPR